MNALLIITLVILQDDGSVTRQREMQAFPSMEACQSEMKAHGEALATMPGPPRQFHLHCEPMATLEVLEPPRGKGEAKKPLPPIVPDRNL